MMMVSAAAPDLCAPDPRENVCADIPVADSRKWAATHGRIRELLDAYDAAGSGEVTELGTLMSQLRPAVESRVREAVRIMTRLVRRHPGIPPEQVPILEASLRECGENVEVWYTTELNGAVTPSTRPGALL